MSEDWQRAREEHLRSEIYQESRRREEQRRLWNKASREVGAVCGRCGKAFADDEWRYRAQVYGEPFMMMCKDCAPEWLSSGKGKPPRVIPAVGVHVWECAGCGCEVAFGMSEYQYRERVYCSDRCRAKYRRERGRARRLQREPQAQECEVCGSEFMPKRSDAKTCSPACRQKAYRERKARVRS